MSLQYIITGTGRCGTGFMSKVFSSAGVPCGHEAVFGNKLKKPGKLKADSSCFAVPYLETRDFTHATVIHLVRNPWDVMRNFIFDGNSVFSVWGTTRPADRWKIEACPPTIFAHKSPIARALAFYVNWNERIVGLSGYTNQVDNGMDFENGSAADHILNTGAAYTLYRWRVEDDPRRLLDWCGIVNRENLYNNRRYNTRRRTNISRDEIDALLKAHATLYSRFVGMAEVFGYTTEEPQ